MDSAMFLASLTSLLVYIPTFIVGVIIIIVAIVRWKKHPSRSLLTILAFLLMGIVTVGQTLVNVNIPIYLYDNVDIPTAGMMLSAIALVTSFLRAAAYIMLLFAIFGKDKKKARVDSAPVDFDQA